MSICVLQVVNYSKQFYLHAQKKVIPSSRNVSFTLYSGRLIALIGPTGSGKSSVLKGIYRTYIPSAGHIFYTDASGSKIDLALASDKLILELRQREIGYVTQFLHCLPRQITLDVVSQPLINLGISRQEAHMRAAALLEALNIPDHLWNIPPATFSGGERQRVNIARGLINKPRLLLLDEPTASLDLHTSHLVIELLKGLKEEGVGIVAIFHNPELTDCLADQVVELTLPS